MPPVSLKPIAPAFARRALAATAWVVVVSVASFALFGGTMHRRAMEQSAIEQAQLIAASLQPGAGGDVTQSIARMLDRCDRVLAVATLDATGALHTVFPERPAHRAALDRVRQALTPRLAPGGLPFGATSVSILNPLTGEPTTAMGAIATLNGIPFLDAQRIAVLLRDDMANGPVMSATTIFAGPVAAAGLFGVLSLSGWFRRRVATPLRDMASVVADPNRPHGRRRGDRSSAWRETSEISMLFDELMHGMAQSHAEHNRATIEAERSLAEREREYEQRLRHANDRAFTDGMTQLRNRAFLEDQLERIYTDAEREGHGLSAVLIDVDHFKQHNDTHGHQAGDQLLRFIGALLKGAIRPDDFAIRYGGDEFVLLLPGCDGQVAGTIAERILKLFGQYARRMGKATNVSLSAGVACARSDGAQTGHDLIAQADAALYSAKRVGRNTVASVQSARTSASSTAKPLAVSR